MWRIVLLFSFHANSEFWKLPSLWNIPIWPVLEYTACSYTCQEPMLAMRANILLVWRNQG